MKDQKYTTIALKENQYLLLFNSLELFSLLPEIYCIGYTDDIKDPELCGLYLKQNLMQYTKFF